MFKCINFLYIYLNEIYNLLYFFIHKNYNFFIFFNLYRKIKFIFCISNNLPFKYLEKFLAKL